jgi:hypothetical protein
MKAIGGNHHKLVASWARARARLIVGVAELNPQSEVPQLSFLEEIPVPGLQMKIKK